MKLKLSLAALLLASAMPVAANAAVSANLSTSYTNVSGSGGDIWNIDGALGDSFGNWGAEVTGGYHSSGGSSGNAGGAIYYAGTSYRIAISGNYLDLGGLHLANYGVGGEWYASSQFTVALRGGGVSGSGSSSGGYGGGDVKFYVTPDLALSAGGDYIDISGTGISSEDIRAEWLISQSFPVSVFGGYSHVDAGSSADVFFVGVKIYLNEPGGGALVDRQRGGNLGYIDGMPYLGKVL